LTAPGIAGWRDGGTAKRARQGRRRTKAHYRSLLTRASSVKGVGLERDASPRFRDGITDATLAPWCAATTPFVILTGEHLGR
jgi:hypothetical protein